MVAIFLECASFIVLCPSRVAVGVRQLRKGRDKRAWVARWFGWRTMVKKYEVTATAGGQHNSLFEEVRVNRA